MSTAEKLNYLLETKNQIRNAIEGKGVSIADTDSFRSYASKIGQIESGDSTTDAFWNARTNGGTDGEGLFAYASKEICENADFLNFVENMDTSRMKSFKYMFQLSNFTELDFSNWDMSAANNIGHMFYYTSLIKIDISSWNLNDFKSLDYFCYSSSNLTEINLSNCDTSSVITMSSAFMYCSKLTKILGILDFSETTGLYGVFGSVASNSPRLLEEVRIKNLNKTGLNLSYCTALSYDSLIYLINNLVETTTAKTVSLGSENLAKLTQEEIAIATEKGWTLA